MNSSASSRSSLAVLARQIGRFLLVGLANTLLTGAIFYYLSSVVAPTLAYTLAFGIGIGFAVTVTPRFVFEVRPQASRRAAYAVWYAVVYLIGLGIVRLLDEVARADRLVVVGLTVAATATLGFLGGRALLIAQAARGTE